MLSMKSMGTVKNRFDWETKAEPSSTKHTNFPRYPGSSSNPDYNAEGLPPGKTVEVQVVAANANGDQGPAGDAAQVVVT